MKSVKVEKEKEKEKEKENEIEPNRIGEDGSRIQPRKLEDSLLGYLTDSGKPQEISTQHSRREAVDYYTETGCNQVFVKDENEHMFSNRSKMDNPNSAFLQDCRKKVCNLLEGNLLLEKQRRTAGAMQNLEGSIVDEYEVYPFLLLLSSSLVLLDSGWQLFSFCALILKLHSGETLSNKSIDNFSTS